MKKITLLFLAGICLLTLSLGMFYLDRSANKVVPFSSTSLPGTDIVFTGVINNVNYRDPTNRGSPAIKVDEQWIDIAEASPDSLMGLDVKHLENSFGKKVKVSAKVVNAGDVVYTTIGNGGGGKYYVKVLQ